MASGWVKNWRQIKDWQWYKTPGMAHLFQHLIREANHKPQMWESHVVQRGQIICGRKSLSKDTGLSEQTIRTCIERLKSTSEINIVSTSKYSIITICNYNIYNSNEDDCNQQINQDINQQVTSNQPASNQQVTTNKNDKNVRSNTLSLNEGENLISEALRRDSFITINDCVETGQLIGLTSQQCEGFYYHYDTRFWKIQTKNGDVPITKENLKSAMNSWRLKGFKFDAANGTHGQTVKANNRQCEAVGSNSNRGVRKNGFR